MLYSLWMSPDLPLAMHACRNFVAYMLRPPPITSTASTAGAASSSEDGASGSGDGPGDGSEGGEAGLGQEQGMEKGLAGDEGSRPVSPSEEELATRRRMDRIYSLFVSQDDEFRNARLKMLPRVVEGPWLVKKAVGKGNAAAKIGEHLKVEYYRGDNYSGRLSSEIPNLEFF